MRQMILETAAGRAGSPVNPGTSPTALVSWADHVLCRPSVQVFSRSSRSGRSSATAPWGRCSTSGATSSTARSTRRTSPDRSSSGPSTGATCAPARRSSRPTRSRRTSSFSSRFGIAEKAVAINEAGVMLAREAGAGWRLRGGLGRADGRRDGRALRRRGRRRRRGVRGADRGARANRRRHPALRDLPPPGRDRDRAPHRQEAVFGADRRPDVVRGGRRAPRRQHSRAGGDASSAASAPTSSG